MASGLINVRDYGAIGDGVHDDTQAINNALAAVSSQGATIYFPDLLYLVTNTLSISRTGTHLVGAGKTATKFEFNPATPLPLFDFNTQATVLPRCSIRRLTLKGSGVIKKIGIRAIDTSELKIEDIAFETWTGDTSIGIQLKGRELTTISRVAIFADRPISVEDNPNSTIDCDHLHCQDLYLVPQVAAESCIYIQPNINVTSLIIDGTNAFCKGKHGIYWNDTAPTEATSLHINIKNVRREQTEVSDGYTLYFNHYIQNLKFENVDGDAVAKGFYFRKCSELTLDHCFYDGTTLTTEIPEGLNIDETCKSVNISNCFWQLTSTRSIGNLESVWSSRKNNFQQFPPNEILDIPIS